MNSKIVSYNTSSWVYKTKFKTKVIYNRRESTWETFELSDLGAEQPSQVTEWYSTRNFTSILLLNNTSFIVEYVTFRVRNHNLFRVQVFNCIFHGELWNILISEIKIVFLER